MGILPSFESCPAVRTWEVEDYRTFSGGFFYRVRVDLNEAMACGKPVIASEACGCAPDLIVQGETGYSFKLGDTRTIEGTSREA